MEHQSRSRRSAAPSPSGETSASASASASAARRELGLQPVLDHRVARDARQQGAVLVRGHVHRVLLLLGAAGRALVLRRDRPGERRRGFGLVLRPQALAEHGHRLRRRVDEVQQLEVVGADGAVAHQGVEVHDLVPVPRPVEQCGHRRVYLAGLRQGEELEQLVQGAEASREHDDGPRDVGEPQLAHEEVAELEREPGGDERVGALLVGQADVEADGAAARLLRAAVGGLHDAGAAAGAHQVAVGRALEAFGPLRDQARELARRGVVLAQGPVLA